MENLGLQVRTWSTLMSLIHKKLALRQSESPLVLVQAINFVCGRTVVVTSLEIGSMKQMFAEHLAMRLPANSHTVFIYGLHFQKIVVCFTIAWMRQGISSFLIFSFLIVDFHDFPSRGRRYRTIFIDWHSALSTLGKCGLVLSWFVVLECVWGPWNGAIQ